MSIAAIIPRPSAGVSAMLVCGLLFCSAARAASPQAPGPAAVSRTGAASAGLPQRTLKIELRCVPIATATATPALSPGSVVVGTNVRVDPGPVVTARSGTAREPAPMLQLLVTNGERAGISLQQVAEQWTLDAIWAAAPAQRAETPVGRPPAASGAGLLRRESRVSMRQLEVLPRWLGGTQPVQLWVAALQSAQPGSETAAGQAGLRVETQLLLALDRWTPLARLPAASSSPTGLSAPAQEWQLRISLEPE